MSTRETPTATFTNEGGVVCVRVREGATQSLDDARQNLDVATSLVGPSRSGLLVDIRSSQPLSSDVRHFYSGEKLFSAFTAVAMLVKDNPLGRMMGRVYLRIADIGVPANLFEDEQAAVAWLREAHG